MCHIFLFSYKPRKTCEMSINIMNNRRHSAITLVIQTYLCTIQSNLQLIELSYCDFLGNENTALHHINNKEFDKDI